MNLTVPNEVKKIEIYNFNDGTAGVMLFFGTADEVYGHQENLEAMGFTVSHVGIAHAFFIKDLHITHINGPLATPTDAVLSYNEFDIHVSAIQNPRPYFKVDKVRDLQPD